MSVTITQTAPVGEIINRWTQHTYNIVGENPLISVFVIADFGAQRVVVYDSVEFSSGWGRYSNVEIVSETEWNCTVIPDSGWPNSVQITVYAQDEAEVPAGEVEPWENTASLRNSAYGQYVHLATPLAYDVTTAFSISLWFRGVQAVGGVDDPVWLRNQANYTSPGWVLRQGRAGSLTADRFYFGLSSGIVWRITAAADALIFNPAYPLYNTWMHFAITYPGTGVASHMNFYLNGAPTAKTKIQSFPGGSPISTDAPRIFSHLDVDGDRGPLNARISNLVFWDRALTPSEVSSVYGVGAPHDLRLLGFSDAIARWYWCGSGYDKLLVCQDRGADTCHGAMVGCVFDEASYPA